MQYIENVSNGYLTICNDGNFSDISLHIFKFLPLQDIHSLNLVNKIFHKGHLNDCLWKKLSKRDFIDDYKNLMQPTNYETYKWCIELTQIKVTMKINISITEISKMDCLQPRPMTIKFLSPKICKIVSLTSICLGNNQIPSLPNEIGQLTNLEIIFTKQ
jgi:Leucine-rich repeat (LRR) protein